MQAESVGGCASSVHQRGVFNGIGKGNLQLPGPDTEPSKISKEGGSRSS